MGQVDGQMKVCNGIKKPFLSSQCLLVASGQSSDIGWGIMTCLGTLFPGQKFLVYRFCRFPGDGSMGNEDMNFLNVLNYNSLGTRFRACFRFQLQYSSSGRMILSMCFQVLP